MRSVPMNRPRALIICPQDFAPARVRDAKG